jgi:hypothetical protein
MTLRKVIIFHCGLGIPHPFNFSPNINIGSNAQIIPTTPPEDEQYTINGISSIPMVNN